MAVTFKIFKNNAYKSRLDFIDFFAEIFAEHYPKNDISKAFDAVRCADLLLVGAYAEHKLIGAIAGFRNVEEPDIFYSWMIAVTPALRNQGIGSKLIEQQELAIKKQNYKFVVFEATKHHVDVIRLRLKYGFEIIGVKQSQNPWLKVVFRKNLM
jgi:ribosomal protein S18 acetylase RimI-like enzyme